MMRCGQKVFKFFLQNIEFILGIYYTTHSILSPNNSPVTCFQVCLCYAKNLPFLKTSLWSSALIVCWHNIVFGVLVKLFFSQHISSIFQTRLHLLLRRYQWKKLAKNKFSIFCYEVTLETKERCKDRFIFTFTFTLNVCEQNHSHQKLLMCVTTLA